MPEGPLDSIVNVAASAAAATAAERVTPPSHKPHGETAQEMVMSIIIAFAMAFVFRGFVIEAFVIPTGSMGPTLLGQHMRFHDDQSGTTWPVTTWRGSPVTPDPVQTDIDVHDPMSGSLHSVKRTPTLSGDRILVLKYLYAVFEPRRYDVVVFKNPAPPAGGRDTNPGPADNYIKRLIGLPGEHIALIDGDVFVRPASDAERPLGSIPTIDPRTYWQQPGWTIARKGLVEQRALWQTIFDSSFAPIPTPSTFSSPWAASSTPAPTPTSTAGGTSVSGWSFANPRVYEYTGSAPTTLAWDQSRTRYADQFGQAKWAINDRYAYDEVPPPASLGIQLFPVSDLRLRAGIEPLSDTLTVSASLNVRRHEFVLELSGSTATLKARQPQGEMGIMTWTTLGTAAIKPLKAGEIRNVELWHSDQSLRAFVDEEQVIGPIALEWTPAQRLLLSTGETIDAIAARQEQIGGTAGANYLGDPHRYLPPQVAWNFSGGGVRLYRVGLDRDIYYQPGNANSLGGGPSLGTSPFQPLILRDDQFFCCGDNSPQSLDGRLWGYPEAWVSREFGRYAGVVPRDLLMGRAFFVYWPSLIKGKGMFPVPDFGRMRMIW